MINFMNWTALIELAEKVGLEIIEWVAAEKAELKYFG
jgi:hypothetical protein